MRDGKGRRKRERESEGWKGKERKRDGKGTRKREREGFLFLSQWQLLVCLLLLLGTKILH